MGQCLFSSFSFSFPFFAKRGEGGGWIGGLHVCALSQSMVHGRRKVQECVDLESIRTWAAKLGIFPWSSQLSLLYSIEYDGFVVQTFLS